MKCGDIITIYIDPITRTIPEGPAELLEKIGEPESVFYDKNEKAFKIERWEVRFVEDDFVCPRDIRVDP